MRFLHFLALIILGMGCGRTEVVRWTLYPDASVPDAGIDAGFDAGIDAGVDAGMDAGIDAGIDAGPCQPRPLPLVPAVPTVMFVIDRSGSMLQDLDGNEDAGIGSRRWDVLSNSLRSVLPPLDRQIAMGALMYPVSEIEACTTSTVVDLSPAQGNATSLLNLFNTRPGGGTTTADALRTAATHLSSIHTATSARAVILATDGAPNCNQFLDEDTCVCTSPPFPGVPNCPGPTHCLDDTRTIAALRGLFSMRLPTYVIGIGSQLNQFASTLDAMAVAGGVPRMGIGPRYYSVSNQLELTDAFTRITAQLTRCTFLLNGLGANDTFSVEVDGQQIPEGPGGWEWLDRTNGELALQGMACDRAAMGGTANVLVDCH